MIALVSFVVCLAALQQANAFTNTCHQCQLIRPSSLNMLSSRLQSTVCVDVSPFTAGIIP